MTQMIFTFFMVALISIGFYCASRMTSDNPLWVRLIVLGPCLTAFMTLIAITQGKYIAYNVDIFRSISVILLYALVASRFSDSPLLSAAAVKRWNSCLFQ